MKSDRSADFIRNMTAETEAEPGPPVNVPPTSKRRKPSDLPSASPPISRAGLKHIGGYVGMDTVEKVALLRVRLNLDNSELIKRAIDELYARHHANRVFGDA